MALQQRFGVSERRACRVVGQARSTQRLPAPVPSDVEVDGVALASGGIQVADVLESEVVPDIVLDAEAPSPEIDRVKGSARGDHLGCQFVYHRPNVDVDLTKGNHLLRGGFIGTPARGDLRGAGCFHPRQTCGWRQGSTDQLATSTQPSGWL